MVCAKVWWKRQYLHDLLPASQHPLRQINEAAGICCGSPNSIYQLSGVHLTGAFGPSHCMYARLRVRLL